jgi:hypothetical protein
VWRCSCTSRLSWECRVWYRGCRACLKCCPQEWEEGESSRTFETAKRSHGHSNVRLPCPQFRSLSLWPFPGMCRLRCKFPRAQKEILTLISWDVNSGKKSVGGWCSFMGHERINIIQLWGSWTFWIINNQQTLFCFLKIISDTDCLKAVRYGTRNYSIGSVMPSSSESGNPAKDFQWCRSFSVILQQTYAFRSPKGGISVERTDNVSMTYPVADPTGNSFYSEFWIRILFVHCHCWGLWWLIAGIQILAHPVTKGIKWHSGGNPNSRQPYWFKKTLSLKFSWSNKGITSKPPGFRGK